MTTTIDEKDVEAVEKAFEILNVFLENNDYVAGEDLTIADFSILVSVSMAEVRYHKSSIIIDNFN